jgi:hypothetical protein
MLTVGLTPDQKFKHLEGQPTRLERGVAVVLDGSMRLYLYRRHWSGELQREELCRRHCFHGNRWVGAAGVYSAPQIVGEGLVLHFGEREISPASKEPWTLFAEEMSNGLTLRCGQDEEGLAVLQFSRWLLGASDLPRGWGEPRLPEIMIAPAGFFIGAVEQLSRAPRGRASALAA